ncbi:MAG: arylsulfatase [Myxococcota bacterium]|jgi:arylsulfatase
MAWTRRRFVGSAGAATAAAGTGLGVRAFAGGAPGGDPGDTPNILYIYTDQLRHDFLGCAGHPVAFTPNMDRLGNSGVRFARCYTNSPLCRPARVSMVTGVYPHQHGVQNNASPEVLPTDVPSHVRTMRDLAGYRTGIIGKAHLHTGEGHMDDWVWLMQEWGYTDVIETPGEFMSRRKGSAFSDALTAMTPEGDDDLYGVHTDFMQRYADEWHRVKEWETEPIDMEPWNLGLEHHIDTFVANTSADWIRTVPRDRPWYLQCNFPGPHPPWNAPSRYLDQYMRRIDEIPVGTMTLPGRPWSGLVRLMQAEVNVPRTLHQIRLMRAKYLARVSMLDELIGRVLEALTESGQDRNTWVILSSDHGEMVGDHSLVGKIVFFDPSCRVPLLIRPPTTVPFEPFVSDALTDQMDVLTTLLKLGGVAPDDVGFGPDGSPLIDKVLAGPDHPGAHSGRDSVFAEVYNHAMLLDSRHKVVVDEMASRPVELYDMELDPEERVNLVNTPEYADVQAGALAQIEARLSG